MWTDEAQCAREEHHDNRYEDGDYVTGTVADYDDWQLPKLQSSELTHALAVADRIARAIMPGAVLIPEDRR